VAVDIIAKLPTSWRDFATSLKHKRKDISTESLITTFDVEEKARAKDAPSTYTTTENGASANVIVGKNNHNNKSKGKMHVVNVTIGKNNSDEVDPSGYGNLPFVFFIRLVGGYGCQCSRMFLLVFVPFLLGSQSYSILTGNRSAASVLRVGTVKLKLTLGKVVYLKNVQHAPTINMNLISVSLLCRDGYKLVYLNQIKL
jgi:hypothetical protein